MKENPTTLTQLSLPLTTELITVHCFFGYCRHVTQSTDPEEAHDLMEQHYAEKHTQEIDRIIYRLTGRKP